MKINWRVLFGVILIAIILFAGLVWVNWTLTRSLVGGDDFFVTWTSARTVLSEQVNPYTKDAAVAVQRRVYGRVASDGEYPYRLDIPFHIFLFFLPLGIIEDFALARAVWMAASEVALLGVALISMDLARWKSARFSGGLYLCFAFLSWISLSALKDGSVAPFLALSFVAAFWLLREGQDEFAGFLLILTAYRWETTWLLWLFLLVWLLSQRRQRVWTTMWMSFAVLVVISLILLPDWPSSFLRASVANFRVGRGLMFTAVLQDWLPGGGRILAIIIRLLALLALFVEWRAARGKDFRRFVWTASITIASAPLIGLPLPASDFVFLLLPLALVMSVSAERWSRVGSFFSALIPFSLLLVWLPIWPNAAMSASRLTKILFVAAPVFLLIALYWLRWWILRPPRTWADRAADFRQR